MFRIIFLNSLCVQIRFLDSWTIFFGLFLRVDFFGPFGTTICSTLGALACSRTLYLTLIGLVSCAFGSYLNCYSKIRLTGSGSFGQALLVHDRLILHLGEQPGLLRTHRYSSCSGPSVFPRHEPAVNSPLMCLAIVEEPMQLGGAHLTPEEQEQCLREGRGVYCTQKGHFLANCPLKGAAFQ